MDLKPGVYRHFKGGYYLLINIARHSESGEEMVVYQALYGVKEWWVRPAAMWTQEVLHEGQRVRRFSPVSAPGPE